MDEVHLRNGTTLRGRVIEESPGRFVVLETEDGRRRTLNFDTVAEIAMAKRGPVTPAPSWNERSGHRVTYELRADVAFMLSAPRKFHPSGSCATGNGTSPVSIYGQTASARMYGTGGGVGLRGGYMYLAPPDPSAHFPFWALRAGAGIDLDYLYVHVPTGMPDLTGELCVTVQKRAPYLKREHGSMLLVRVPLQMGAHVGIGSFRDAFTWRGIVVGASWSPSLTHLEPSVGPRDTSFRWFGTEVTLDFVTLHAAPSASAFPAHWRVAAQLSPPNRQGDPLLLALSLGAVWY